MKKLTAYIATILISSPLFAAKISDSQLELGRESAADNKEILFNIGEGTGNPKIRANYSTKKLEFSNDGTNFSEFGTGEGAMGYNIIDNSGFESDLTNWTNTGSGSLSVDTDAADVYQGDKSALWDAAAASDVLASEAVTIPGGLRGNLCSVEVQYKGGDDNLKLQAYDGTNVLAEVALEASANFSKAMVTLTCPSSGTLQGRLIASADAAAVNVDNWVVGKSADIIGFSTTKKGSAYLTRTATPQSIPSATETYISWSQLNDSSIDGIWSAGDPTKFVIPASLNGSKVRLSSQLNIDRDASGVSSLVRVSMSIRKNGNMIARTFWRNDGTDTFSEWHASVISPPIVVATGDYFEVSIFATFTAGAYSFIESPSAPSFFAIEQIDEAVTSNTVQRVETSAWSVNTSDGNFYTLPLTTQAEWYVSSNASGQITNRGSLDAKILCNGAVSTGTTCSGVNELSGIVFDAPRAGKAFICSNFNIFLGEGSGSVNPRNIFSIFKVPTDGSVSAGLRNTNWTSTEQIGNAVMETVLSTAGHYLKIESVTICGLTDVVAGSNGYLLGTDIDINFGTLEANQIRGIGFTVFPIEQQLPQALIVPSVGGVFGIYDQDATGLSDGVWANIGPTLDLPAGTYVVNYLATGSLAFSSIPLRGFCQLRIIDSGSVTIETSGADALTRIFESSMSCNVSGQELITWPGGTMQLQGVIDELSGTTTSRAFSKASLKATKISD